MADPIIGVDSILQDYAIAKNLTSTGRRGKSGQIKAVIHQGKAQFFVPQLNEYFTSYEIAVRAVEGSAGTGRFITDLSIVEPIRAGQPRPGFGLDKAGSGRQIFTDMLTRMNQLSENERRILSTAGINVDDFFASGQMFQAKFEINNETLFGSEKAARGIKFKQREAITEKALLQVQKILGGTQDLADTAVMGQGIQVLEAENAMKVIGFRYTDSITNKMTHLTSYQANLLAAVVGNGFFNPEMFDKMFGFRDGQFVGVKAGNATAFASKALKIGKRLKASFGERPISLAGDDLATFLSNGVEEMVKPGSGRSMVSEVNRSLSDHVLITDFEFDVMRNWALGADNPVLDEMRNQADHADAQKVLYRNLKSGNYVDSVIDFFTGKGMLVDFGTDNLVSETGRQGLPVSEAFLEEEIEAVRLKVAEVLKNQDGGQYIQVYNRETGRFGSDVLLEELEKEFGGKDTKQYKLVKAMMESAELAKDGADVANAGYIRAQIKTIDQSIQNLTNQIDGMTNEVDKQLLRDELNNLKRLKSNFQNALDHGGQVTGRISVSGLTTAKNIVAVAELEEAFDNIAFILNKTSFKSETALAGARANVTEYINLQGIVSGYSENVKVDYAAAAAHGSVFATEEHYRAAEQRASILMSELDDALESNVLSPRVRSIVERMATADPEELADDANEFAIRSAVKKQQQALVVQQYISMGGQLSDNPEIVNALFDIVNREIYRSASGGDAKIVMANVYRFGIDSEAGLYGRTKYRGIAGQQQYQASEIFLDGKNGKAFGGEAFDIAIGEGADRKLFPISNEASQEVIKFRVADHKILLAEDAVAKYTHALGGFDLDDKGIPIITRFTTGDGVKRLAFNVFRQPTGPEEMMFMLPNYDVGTVRSILRFDPKDPDAINDMSELFREFRSQYGSVEGGRFSHLLRDDSLSLDRAQMQESLGVLEQIMQGDGAINGLYNYEKDREVARKVERALLDLFEFGEEKELTTISEIDTRQAKRIQAFGTSSLRAVPGQGDVGYTTDGIFKIFDESGAFDLSKGLENALRDPNVALSATEIDRIMNTPILADPTDSTKMLNQFESRMQVLGEITASKPGGAAIRNALYSTAFGFNAANGLASAADGALGQYINTTMVVSSMMDQYQDFLHAAFERFGPGDQFENIYNSLLKFNVGMISQESAIDISVNQGTSRAISQMQTKAAFLQSLEESGYPVNRQAAEDAIMKLMDLKDGQYAKTSLKELNEAISPGIIRQTAYIRGLAESLNLDGVRGLYGFDENLFDSRMLRNSPAKVIDYLNDYAAGLQEFFAFAEASGLAEATDAQKNLVANMVSIGQRYELAEGYGAKEAIQGEALELLRSEESGFFLSGDRATQYANVSRLAEASKSVDKLSRAKRTIRLRQAHQNELSALNAVLRDLPEAAVTAAQNIVEEYEEKLQAFRKDRLRDLADIELEKAVLERNKTFTGLYAEISRLAESNQMSQYDLFTALDAQFQRAKIDLGNLQTTQTDAFGQVIQGIQRTRRYRGIQNALSRDINTVGQDLFDSISRTIDGIDGATFAERLKTFLDADADNVKRFNELEIDMINRLLNRGLDTSDFIDLRRIANITEEIDNVTRLTGEALMARSILAEEDRVYGAFAARANLEDEDFSDLLRFGTKEVELDDVTVKRTPYKRITDKISEREFLDIIQRPAVKKTLYGMAALIGFSFVYQGTQDRTAADMSGPPLLPGGSAYETSPGLGPVNIENVPYTGYNSGMSYQVSLHGDQDAINRFRQSINDLDYGNYSTTMYNNLPRLGRDLYADAAPDF